MYQNTHIQICCIYSEGKYMENSVIAIHQSYVITTIVYALLAPVFFEMDNTHGERENFVDNDKTMYSQQVVEEVETE